MGQSGSCCTAENDKESGASVEILAKKQGGVCEEHEPVLILGGHSTPRVLRFEVTLSKDGEDSFGLAQAPLDEHNFLVVHALKQDGAVFRWNSEQAQKGRLERTLRLGDIIVSVGDAVSLEAMRANLLKDQVRLTIERWPPMIIATLEKKESADKYGMKTETGFADEADGAEMLRVTEIIGGLLGKWNLTCASSERFCDVVPVGSNIIRVGTLSSCREMQQALVSESLVVITFERPSLASQVRAV